MTFESLPIHAFLQLFVHSLSDQESPLGEPRCYGADDASEIARGVSLDPMLRGTTNGAPQTVSA